QECGACVEGGSGPSVGNPRYDGTNEESDEPANHGGNVTGCARAVHAPGTTRLNDSAIAFWNTFDRRSRCRGRNDRVHAISGRSAKSSSKSCIKAGEELRLDRGKRRAVRGRHWLTSDVAQRHSRVTLFAVDQNFKVQVRRRCETR